MHFDHAELMLDYVIIGILYPSTCKLYVIKACDLLFHVCWIERILIKNTDAFEQKSPQDFSSLDS